MKTNKPNPVSIRSPRPSPVVRAANRVKLLSCLLPVLCVSPAQAQTVGGGSLANPAVGPAPAYNYGYGSNISGAVLVKNWDFGSGVGNTVRNMSEMSGEFNYHDQFGSIVNNGNYGAKIVSPDSTNSIWNQPVEGVNTASPVREFFPSSLKTYLVPLDGATTLNPMLQNTGNGSFVAKWSAPNGGALLGMDIIWETRVRYVTPPYFWFAIWAAGNQWGGPSGAEMDVIESFGYDNGWGYTNFDGRYWHSSVIGNDTSGTAPRAQTETDYLSSSWDNCMARYGFNSFDATQWHTWTWVYKADNTFVVYLDGIPVQRGQSWWTFGAYPPDSDNPPINMHFLFDASWSHKDVNGLKDFTLPASAMVGKFFEWDYSRIYYRQPTPSDIKNHVLTATISGYSSQESNNPASRLIDDIYNTDTNNRWSPTSGTNPQWVEFDLGSDKQISETHLIGSFTDSYRYRVEARTATGSYSTIVDKTASTSTSPIMNSTFAPVTARYVKLTITGSSTGAGWIQTREFKIMGSNVAALPSSDLALNKPATASSVQWGNIHVAANACDGNSTTRWSTEAWENQWIFVDLGSVRSISSVKLNWEVAYASGYKIQVSENATSWTDIYTTTTGNGGVDDLSGVSGSGRYVRVLCLTRGTAYGISLWDFEVHGPPANLALNKPATASNVQWGDVHVAANAFDGNSTTRWSTEALDNQWIHVDLGSVMPVSRVKLNWETAYASGYRIQVSNNGTNWADIYTTTSSNGNIDDLEGLTGSGRYVRVICVTRATGYGVSLWDFEVY